MGSSIINPIVFEFTLSSTGLIKPMSLNIKNIITSKVVCPSCFVEAESIQMVDSSAHRRCKTKSYNLGLQRSSQKHKTICLIFSSLLGVTVIFVLLFNCLFNSLTFITFFLNGSLCLFYNTATCNPRKGKTTSCCILQFSNFRCWFYFFSRIKPEIFFSSFWFIICSKVP